MNRLINKPKYLKRHIKFYKNNFMIENPYIYLYKTAAFKGDSTIPHNDDLIICQNDGFNYITDKPVFVASANYEFFDDMGNYGIIGFKGINDNTKAVETVEGYVYKRIAQEEQNDIYVDSLYGLQSLKNADDNIDNEIQLYEWNYILFVIIHRQVDNAWILQNIIGYPAGKKRAKGALNDYKIQHIFESLQQDYSDIAHTNYKPDIVYS